MDWNQIWNDIRNFFVSNGWNILGFFATLILGILVIKILINIIKRVLSSTKMEKIAMQFIVGILKFLLYLVLVLILLSIIGVQISGLITALSAILLAVGVALEGNIANFANGIVIVTTRMFTKGDYIIVGGVEGNIVDINFLFTTLITVDNRRVTLPNSTIVNSAVTNNGANNTRRVDITFSVAYESDVELVKKVVTDVMKSNGQVYLDKDIFCRLKVMNSSSLDFFAYCWCDKEDYWDVYYYLMENVYNEFKRNNISVPFNQVEVRNRTDEVVMPVVGKSLPRRVEKVRNTKKSFSLESADLTKIFKHDSKSKKKKADKNVEVSVKQTEKAETEQEVTVKVDDATQTNNATQSNDENQDDNK